jgi:hypothetical protein
VQDLIIRKLDPTTGDLAVVQHEVLGLLFPDDVYLPFQFVVQAAVESSAFATVKL